MEDVYPLRLDVTMLMADVHHAELLLYTFQKVKAALSMAA